jgi:ubiquinone/menaquinone biosynthesis C-methylase UbiE
MAQIAKISAGDHVLDVGCGTGVFTREAMRLVGKSGTVTGADLSESMLTVARAECPAARLEQCSVMSLPFGDGQFDAVVSSFMLMFVPEPATGLKEMDRVLRPGGHMAISVWEGLSSNAVYSALVDIVGDVVSEEAAASIAWPFALGAEGRLAELFEQAGLTENAVSIQAGRALFPSVSEFVKTEIDSWLLADSVSEYRMAEIVARAESEFARYCDASRRIEFPFNAAVVSYVKPSSD